MRLWRSLIVAASLTAAFVGAPAAFSREAFTPPDVFVLGDSQISFGKGPVLTRFFENIESECVGRPGADLAGRLQGATVGLMGVRSTSLASWTAPRGRLKNFICAKDKTWGVNASMYGALLNPRRGKWEQVGENASGKFCERGKTAFEAMFAPGYYAPKLFVMSFLGNGAGTWASKPETAAEHVRRVVDQLPPDMPCVFMTTAPAYKAKMNATRVRGQAAVFDAFRDPAVGGGRCALVAGLTPDTIGALEGVARHYRRRKNGTVKDPFHPVESGAEAWLDLRRDAICQAVTEALGPPPAPEPAALAPEPEETASFERRDRLDLER